MPILSVVVPTHNRSDYAISCIESVLEFGDADLQLVISDTSTDGRLAEMLHSDTQSFLDDPRLKYTRITEPSNVTKNYNDAVSQADGEFVCIIGDDDCITRAGIEAARWAARHGEPIVSQTIAANYAWPDFRSRLARGGHAARLYLPRKLRPPRWRNSATELSAALGRALQGTDGMPRCYHGIVRLDLLNKVRELTGAYFRASSPDMSSSVSLACLVDRYLEVDTPLSIPGASGGSNSGRAAMNTHKGDLSSDSQTSEFQERGWPVGVPRFFSPETVWAHAGLEALGQLSPDLLSQFNFVRLWALCNLRYPEYRDITDAAVREVEGLLGQNLRDDVLRETRAERWARRRYLLRRLAMPTAAHWRRYVGRLPTVADASRWYDGHARRTGMHFADIAVPAG